MAVKRSSRNVKNNARIHNFLNMLKNIIAPVQAWLLSQGKCVGCGRVLPKKTGQELVRVECVCGRVYMYDPAANAYRRAAVNEIK